MKGTDKTKLVFSRKMRRFGVKSINFIQTKGKQNIMIFGALVILTLIFVIINSNFLDKYNIVSISQSFAPYAILAIGVTFVIATGGIDLSIGTVCIASAVIAGKLFMSGMPLFLVIPVMIIIGTAFGTLNGYLIAKLRLPAFIATLGTMLFARGLSALIVKIPNIFFPDGTWFNATFSNLNDFPIGLIWVILFMIIAMYLMYKNKIGRYILSIGSNEEATRLSGINTVKYKAIAYMISGMCAGIAAIFWAASFPTVTSAGGSGMELDAIAGVYIGGTSAAGGIASVAGSFIGSLLLVIIRTGLNFALIKFGLDLNSQYVTFVLTGVIVVMAVLMDVIKNKKSQQVKVLFPSQNLSLHTREEVELKNKTLDELISDRALSENEKQASVNTLKSEILKFKRDSKERILKLKWQEGLDNISNVIDKKINKLRINKDNAIIKLENKVTDKIQRDAKIAALENEFNSTAQKLKTLAEQKIAVYKSSKD